MIMGHIKFGSIFDKWIHAFHMPMFFFVSGWFYKGIKDIAIGKKILRKAKSLLLPYIFFELIVWFICSFFVSEYRSRETLFYIFWENTYKIPIESGTFGISPIPGAMWFLTAIFFSELLYILLDHFIDLKWEFHCIIIFMVVAGMLAPKYLPFRLPFAFDASLVGIGFFHIGRMIHRTKAELLICLKSWQVVIAGVLICALIVISPKINLRTGLYGWYIPFWINALGAIIVGLNFSRIVIEFIDRKTPHISKWLKSIGENSITYLCCNQLVILFITKILDIAGCHGLPAKIPVFIGSMLVLFLVEKLFCNTKLKLLIGR